MASRERRARSHLQLVREASSHATADVVCGVGCLRRIERRRNADTSAVVGGNPPRAPEVESERRRERGYPCVKSNLQRGTVPMHSRGTAASRDRITSCCGDLARVEKATIHAILDGELIGSTLGIARRAPFDSPLCRGIAPQPTVEIDTSRMELCSVLAGERRGGVAEPTVGVAGGHLRRTRPFMAPGAQAGRRPCLAMSETNRRIAGDSSDGAQNTN